MIDSDFIIKYTNALYSVDEVDAPRYDEFRDMFSLGQIRSKEWLIDNMGLFSSSESEYSVAISGAWFGTLGLLMKNRFPNMKINMLDIDPRCEKFIHKIIYNDPSLQCITEDMYAYTYDEDIIVNTSCEHIGNIKEWLSLIPEGKAVILQSNNYYDGSGHINCARSKYEFRDQTGLTNIIYSGELKLPMYTRYMIIGTT